MISNHAGSISVEQWDAMSEDRLLELDRVLRKTIDKTVSINLSWSDMAVIVRNDLETIGLVFKTLEMCQSTDDDLDWDSIKNAALPDLVRMRAVVRQSTMGGGPRWWVAEIMSVVLQLMELRGM